MLAFLIAEGLIGGLLGEVVMGRMLSINTNFLLQGLLNLAGFFCGGFVIGLVSRGRRIAEPAVGGFLTMLLIALLTLFVPFRYYGYANSSLFIASCVAALLGGLGAHFGERITGNSSPLSSGANRELTPQDTRAARKTRKAARKLR